MSMEHRYAESQRRVSELKAQIAVMHAGYNGALKERDQLKADLARSVKHETTQENADSVRGYWEKEYRRAIKERDELDKELKAIRIGYEDMVDRLEKGGGLEPCYEDNGCDPDKCAGGHRTMAEVCAKLQRLEGLARECVMSQGEILCDACARVTRALRGEDE